MSGGQQQRVALARALVNRPTVLLLDEPLGALDLKLRKEMQLELKALQQEVGITFVYVTHDQEEALTMSDMIVVMRDGLIQQQGGPTELYERPVNRFVAELHRRRRTRSRARIVSVDAATARRSIDSAERGLRLRGTVTDPDARPGRRRRGRRSRSGRSGSGRRRPSRRRTTEPAGRRSTGRIQQGTYLGDQTEYRVQTDAGGRADRPPPERHGGEQRPGPRTGRSGRRDRLARGGEPGPRGLRSDRGHRAPAGGRWRRNRDGSGSRRRWRPARGHRAADVAGPRQPARVPGRRRRSPSMAAFIAACTRHRRRVARAVGGGPVDRRPATGRRQPEAAVGPSRAAELLVRPTEGALFMYNWADYINPDNIEEFKKRYGITTGRTTPTPPTRS